MPWTLQCDNCGKSCSESEVLYDGDAGYCPHCTVLTLCGKYIPKQEENEHFNACEQCLAFQQSVLDEIEYTREHYPY